MGGNLGASSLPARKLGVRGKMRAEAPEFVSLGIQGDASDVRTNPVKFISEGIHDHTPQPSPRGARGSGPLTPRGLTGLRADAPEFVSLGIPSLIAQPTVMSCMSCQSPEEEKIMRGAKQRTPRGAWNTADAAGSGAKTRKNDKDGGDSGRQRRSNENEGCLLGPARERKAVVTALFQILRLTALSHHVVYSATATATFQFSAIESTFSVETNVWTFRHLSEKVKK